MKRYIVYASTNKVGSECTDEIEVDDDATEEEIEEAARDVAFNMIEWGWKPADNS
jgi:hypothetical protein